MKGFIKILKIYIMRIVMRVFYIFPIKDNRIIINSYKGTQYACNPKYISEKLIELYPGKFEIIWAFNDPKKYRFLEKDGIRLIKFNSLQRFYYEATAKISINNIGSFSWLPLRKGQEHVNTWHAGLNMANCGMNHPDNDKLTKWSIGLSGRETTLFLSPNKVFTDYGVIVQFDYSGKMLNCGLPRSDNLCNEKSEMVRLKTRKALRISSDTVVVLFAPSWRHKGMVLPKMDYKMLAKALECRFGNKYVIWHRSHHLTKGTDVEKMDQLQDLTSYPDVEELILACDILISDYSSVIWDGVLAGKSVLRYVPDAEDFEGRLYVPVDKLCIKAASSMEQLCNYLKSLEFATEHKNAARLLKMMESYETGKAAEIVAAWIANKCNIPTKEELDFKLYMGNSNGIPNTGLLDKLKQYGDAE